MQGPSAAYVCLICLRPHLQLCVVCNCDDVATAVTDDPLLPQAAYPYDTDSGGECGVPYAKRMQPPSVAPLLQWYSVNVGLVHFLQISTEQEFWPGSEQYEFIQKDLESVDRSATPWVIAGFHRPLYVDDPDIQPTGVCNNT